jgi:hypothetical protein
VVVDRARADVELSGDVPIGTPLRHEAGDLSFLRRELAERVHGPLTRTFTGRTTSDASNGISTGSPTACTVRVPDDVGLVQARCSPLSSSSRPGPSRLVSLISVEGSGTRPSSAIRQKRERVRDLPTQRLVAEPVPVLEVHQPQICLDRDRRPADPRRQPRAKRRHEAIVVEDHIHLPQVRRQLAQLRRQDRHPQTLTNRPLAQYPAPPKVADSSDVRTETGRTRSRDKWRCLSRNMHAAVVRGAFRSEVAWIRELASRSRRRR